MLHIEGTKLLRFICNNNTIARPVRIEFYDIYWRLTVALVINVLVLVTNQGRSQWPRGLSRRSAAAHTLRLWIRIPPGGMDVCVL